MEENKLKSREERLIKTISNYNANIDQYRQALQAKAAWLFLAILGCWSVTSGSLLQLFAFVATAVFFCLEVVSELDVRKSFNTFEREIKSLIESEFIGGPKKESYETQLSDLKNKRSSNIQPLLKAPMFFVSFFFYCLSLYDQVYLGFCG